MNPWEEDSFKVETVNDVSTARMALQWAISKIRRLEDELFHQKQAIQEKAIQNRYLTEQLQESKSAVEAQKQKALELQIEERDLRESQNRLKIQIRREVLEEQGLRLREDKGQLRQEIEALRGQISFRDEELARQRRESAERLAGIQSKHQELASQLLLQKEAELEARHQAKELEIEHLRNQVKALLKERDGWEIKHLRLLNGLAEKEKIIEAEAGKRLRESRLDFEKKEALALEEKNQFREELIRRHDQILQRELENLKEIHKKETGALQERLTDARRLVEDEKRKRGEIERAVEESDLKGRAQREAVLRRAFELEIQEREQSFKSQSRIALEALEARSRAELEEALRRLNESEKEKADLELRARQEIESAKKDLQTALDASTQALNQKGIELLRRAAENEKESLNKQAQIQAELEGRYRDMLRELQEDFHRQSREHRLLQHAEAQQMGRQFAEWEKEAAHRYEGALREQAQELESCQRKVAELHARSQVPEAAGLREKIESLQSRLGRQTVWIGKILSWARREKKILEKIRRSNPR